MTKRHPLRPSTPLDKYAEERAAHRAFRRAEAAAREQPNPSRLGHWRFVDGPCETRRSADGTVMLTVRCWAVLCAPGEPVPGPAELHRRFRDGDPDVIEVDGAVAP